MAEQKTIEQLEADLALAEKERDEVLAVNEKLSLEIEKLSNAPCKNCAAAKDAKVNAAEHSFEIDGKKYGFNFSKITYKGQLITPVEVCASKELQQELISIKSGMIKAL